jgi:hypothetical protein
MPLTCIPIQMQDGLAKLEKKLRADHEEKVELILNAGRDPRIPPRGKIRILANDVDYQGREYAIKWMDDKGRISTDKLLIQRGKRK